jgi:hypothetical protein
LLSLLTLFAFAKTDYPTTTIMRSLSFASLILLVVSSLPQASSGSTIFDFAATVIGASLNLEYDTIPEVKLEYYYTGVKPMMEDSSASFTLNILAPGCYGTAQDSAVFFNTFIETTGPDKVTASILIDLSTVKASPTFWKQSEEEEGTIQFCAKWNLFSGGNYANFQKTDFMATVTLTQNGFNVDELDGRDGADANRMDRYSNVDFPSRVFFCNDTGLEIEPPRVINQGTPIDICVEALDQGNGAGVYVDGVEQMSYSATLASGEVTISLLQGGETVDSTAQIDCQSTFGTCHIKFIADERLFFNSRDSENTLSISGLSVISFGDESSRRLSTTPTRSLQQDVVVDGIIPVSDFSFTIQHLNASSGSSTSNTGKAMMTCFTVVFPIVFGALGMLT